MEGVVDRSGSAEEDEMQRLSPFTNRPRSTLIADLAPSVGKPLTTQVYSFYFNRTYSFPKFYNFLCFCQKVLTG